jgi:hypothetical protein
MPGGDFLRATSSSDFPLDTLAETAIITPVPCRRGFSRRCEPCRVSSLPLTAGAEALCLPPGGGGVAFPHSRRRHRRPVLDSSRCSRAGGHAAPGVAVGHDHDHAGRHLGPIVGPVPPPPRSGLRPGRRRRTRGSRGTDQARHAWPLAVPRFAWDGSRCLRRALDRADGSQGQRLHIRRPPSEAASHRMGARGRDDLDRGQHAHRLRHPRRGPLGGLSPLEHEQPGWPPLGLAPVRGASGCRAAAVGQGARRGHRHRGRGMPDGVRDRAPVGMGDPERGDGHHRRARCGAPVGDDVYPLPEGVHQRHEPALVRHGVHVRRTGHGARARRRVRGRLREAGERAVGGGAGPVLAVSRRLLLGDWRPLPAVRGEVHRDRTRNPAVEYEPALGTGVGRSRLRGVRGP